MLKPYIRFVLNNPRPSFNIRAAAETDLAAITAIYNQAVALGYVTADTEPVDLASRREVWLTITQKQQRPFWVLEDNGRVLAFFYFRNFYDRPAYRITAEIGIYIEQSAQQKGLGRQILEFCLEQAPGLGIENILALIFASNQPSIGLFEKYGFEKRGDFPQLARKGADYNDLVILLKRVNC
jgi:phosphinothricin acetyltransferase